MRPSLLIPFLLLAGCVTATPSDAPPGTDRTVEGTVTALDFDPMAYDADGIVTLETNDGEVVRVFLPARSNLCAATYDDWADLEIGSRAAARGAVVEEGAVRPCERTEHYFRLR